MFFGGFFGVSPQFCAPQSRTLLPVDGGLLIPCIGRALLFVARLAVFSRFYCWGSSCTYSSLQKALIDRVRLWRLRTFPVDEPPSRRSSKLSTVIFGRSLMLPVAGPIVLVGLKFSCPASSLGISRQVRRSALLTFSAERSVAAPRELLSLSLSLSGATTLSTAQPPLASPFRRWKAYGCVLRPCARVSTN